MNKMIRLAGIIPESLSNGEGLRRVIFAQGCKHNCKGCFNPHTHSFKNGKLVNMDNIIQNIITNPLLKGVTFSGGDPFEQADKFYYIGQAIKKYNKNIWCYTGYTYEEIIGNRNNKKNWYDLLSIIDVLVDGEFKKELKNSKLKFRGSSNQRIIDVKKSLIQQKVILYMQ